MLKLDAMREGIANYHLWFLVRLSAYLGFYPGNEYIENGCFDIRGGLFTPSMPAHRIGMNEACARLLGTLMECEADALAEIPLSRARRTEFMEAMLSFFVYHFDSIHSVRSISILREVF